MQHVSGWEGGLCLGMEKKKSERESRGLLWVADWWMDEKGKFS